MNKRTFITIGFTNGTDGSPKDGKYDVLYIGVDREKSRAIYLENRSNKDYDFVAMQKMIGFKSRSRPKIDEERSIATNRALAEDAKKVAEAAMVRANAAKEALADAALRAEEEAAKALDKVAELQGETPAQVADETVVELDESKSPAKAAKKATKKVAKKVEEESDEDEDFGA